MKDRLSFLLFIAGGVLGVTVGRSLPVSEPVMLAIAAVGGFLLGFSYLLFNSVYAGTVWGVRIKSSGASKLKQFIGALGMALGGFSFLVSGLELLSSLSAGRVVHAAVLVGLFLVSAILGPFIGKVVSEKTLARDSSAAVLGELPLFRELDGEIGKAAYFVVGFEGAALFSAADYCYAVYRYENYELGELSTPAQVALVGTYFVQRYNKEFTYRVDAEIIPGEPGKTVVAVGTGGVAVARVKGTRDKRLFRSYIFKRK